MSVAAAHRRSQAAVGAAATAIEASRSEWDAGRGSQQGGLNLLRQAQLVGPLLPRRAVESAERALLSLISGRLDQTEDFEALVDLASLSPELFAPPSRGLDSWGEEFSDFLGGERQWLLGELDDSDWLAEEMGRISRVASELRVDTTGLEAAVDERIVELRYEAADLDEDDAFPESDSGFREESPRQEIDSLFQSLL